MTTELDDEGDSSSGGRHRRYQRDGRPNRRTDDDRIQWLEDELERLRDKTDPVTSWYTKMSNTGDIIGRGGKSLASWIIIIIACIAAIKLGLLNWLGIGAPPHP